MIESSVISIFPNLLIYKSRKNGLWVYQCVRFIAEKEPRENIRNPCSLQKEKQFIVVVLAHHGLAFTLTGFNVAYASATG